MEPLKGLLVRSPERITPVSGELEFLSKHLSYPFGLLYPPLSFGLLWPPSFPRLLTRVCDNKSFVTVCCENPRFAWVAAHSEDRSFVDGVQ
jgi:hypothetical protein